MKRNAIIQFATAQLAALLLLCSVVRAQEPGPKRQHFVPADQLDAIFERTPKGVMLPRAEFQDLLQKAQQAQTADQSAPAPIMIRSAAYSVQQSGQHAVVALEIDVEQFIDAWQTVEIPIGNLSVEEATIGGSPATIGRNAERPDSVFLFHHNSGRLKLQLKLSTPLASVGSDRVAAFRVVPQVPTQLKVRCPADRLLEFNDLKLKRPAALNEATDYDIPVGSQEQVRLKWSPPQQTTETQQLVFAVSDVRIQLSSDTLRWQSQTRLSVFGNAINQVVGRVPSRLEITAVDSTGLESWKLEDDPNQAGVTRVILNYRQPFTNDREVRISAVSSLKSETQEPAVLPTLEFADVTAHTGRLYVDHEQQLRLLAVVGSGVRQLSGTAAATGGEVFDFWLQNHELSVSVRPRDRELFAEQNSQLVLKDSTAEFSCSMTIETLNAPLFELTVKLPGHWQLIGISGEDGNAMKWRSTDEADTIVIEPAQPVAAGSLLGFTAKLQTTYPDPATLQTLALPVLTAPDTLLVGGTYQISAAGDLTVSPLEMSGLSPIGDDGGTLLFETQGVEFSGQISIVRKAVRLASRAVLTSWMDTRQKTVRCVLTVDVLNGTTRTLSIRLPEDLGPDVRFQLVSIGEVPGVSQADIPDSLELIEQSPGEVTDSERPFLLTFDKRFHGAVTLTADVQQARTPDTVLTAPFIRVDDAVRQHGLITFEAYPEQQLDVAADQPADSGLTIADAGLVEPAAEGSGRRVALVYRYVQPDYQLTLQETRFETTAVPSAVVERIDNVSVLSDTGTIQRSCRVTFRSSGVQTLKFQLPDAERSFLWSTVLNGEAVEVRSAGHDYLVAIPTGQEQHVLDILFESTGQNASLLGTTSQRSLQLSIDTDSGSSTPIDVLDQTWLVRYPGSSLLVDYDGGFHAAGAVPAWMMLSAPGVDQPGWLQKLPGMLSAPTWSVAAQRLLPVGLILLALFVVTVLIVRRRWKSLAALCVLGGVAVVVPFMLLGSREASRVVTSFDRAQHWNFESGQVGLELSDAEMDFSSNGVVTFDAATESTDQPMTVEESLVRQRAPESRFGRRSGVKTEQYGGMAGGMGGFGTGSGGGFGGGGAFPGGLGALAGSAGQQSGYAQENSGPVPPIALQQGQPEVDPQMIEDLFARPDAAPAPQSQTALPVPASEPAEPPLSGGTDLLFDAGRNAGPLKNNLRAERKGAARLSVRASVAQPDDYRSLTFRSIGGSSDAGTLNIVVQPRSQQLAVRLIVTMLVVLLCLWCRTQPLASRISVGLLLILLTAAAVPLVPNTWQTAVDGAALGTAIGITIWTVCAIIRGLKWLCGRCCGTCCRWFSRSPAAATLLMAAVLTSAAVSSANAQETETSPPEQVTRPEVVLPYTPGRPELLADRIFLSEEEFIRLYRAAYPDELVPEQPPTSGSVTAAFYKSSERRQVKDASWSQTFTARFVIRTFQDNTSVSLPLNQVAVQSARLNGTTAILLAASPQAVPMVSQQGQQPQQELAPNQQAMVQQQQRAVVPPPVAPVYSVQVPQKGLHLLDIVFEVPMTIENSVGRLVLPVLPVPAGSLSFELPEADLDVRINGRSNVYRRDGRTMTVPLSKETGLRIDWRPQSAQTSSDTIVHAAVSSSLSITDAGLTLEAAVDLVVRQGQLPEVELTVPADYAVQQVTGADIAGWNSSESGDRLKILFRQAVDQKTDLQLTFFRRAVFSTERTQVSVPVLSVVGASRDSGNVTVLAGREVEVRVDSLSGVSQVNASEAIVPRSAEQRLNETDDSRTILRRLLAWRYTRHPVAISVRVFRTSDRLNVTALNGVQLESQRQLWTTLINASIEGAPRRRLEIEIPSDFLALSVTAADLADWYYSEASGEEAKTRILNVQFESARTGLAAIVIQGQLAADDLQSVASLQVPIVRGADSVNSQVSLWLDAASEIVSSEAGDWKRAGGDVAIDPRILQLQSDTPDISFASSVVAPGSVTVRLRQAAASLLAESVSVTNVTDTSLELTLGLNWQISRAATRELSFSIPTALADVYDFQIPGLRQLEKQPDGDRVRMILHLQQPVSERFFIVGTGTLPLPDDRRVHPASPLFTDSAGSKASVASQSHFWVIVNQSQGLLEAVDPSTDGSDVAATEITTTIPEGFLQQSVAIRRLKSDRPNSAWQVRYPERQQVAPAVVALAAHETIIAADGTWRSRHTLQVRNESRQFLPVTLPDESRIMFCLVKNQPTRVVSRTIDDRLLHLIPIPQSGEVAEPFEVQFAIAGILPSENYSLAATPVRIPVPEFPEYRDFPDYGITVARNTWAVLTPEEWQAQLLDDPRKSNVIAADVVMFQDLSLMCASDNVQSVVKSLADNRDRLSRGSVQRYLLEQQNLLRSQAGKSEAAENQRQEALKELDMYLGDQVQYFDNQSMYNAVQVENDFLNRSDLNTNGFNSDNAASLLSSNSGRPAIDQDGDGISGSLNFRFSVPEQPADPPADQPAPGKPAAKQQKRKAVVDELEKKSDDGVDAAKSGAVRSRLLERREQNVQEQSDKSFMKRQTRDEKAGEQAPASGSDRSRRLNESEFQQMEPQSRASARGLISNGGSLPDALAEIAAPKSEGKLSLNFAIPQDGHRLNFVRTGGNAELTLKIRDRAAVSGGIGWLWAAVCGVMALILLKAVSRCPGTLIVRISLLTVILGAVAAVCLPSAWTAAATAVTIIAAVLLSVTVIVSSFRKPASC
ncbi:MAG: hypothetical protein R3C49_00995 [Planctomycetaceae bacterium]